MTATASGSAVEPEALTQLRARRSKKWSHYPPDVLPAWLAEMDFPLATPVTDRILERVRLGDLGYPPLAGEHPLPEIFARWAKAQWDLRFQASDVLVVPDVMRGVEMCLQAFSEPGDPVIVFVPIYPPFLESIEDYRRVPVPCPVVPDGESWAFDLAAVRAGLAAGCRLILLCAPHNPTGHVVGSEELTVLAELAQEYDAVIVSDEVHAPMTYERSHRPMATISEAVCDRTVTLFSASKTWNLAGLRAALAVVTDPALRARLAGLPRRFGNGTGILGMEAAVAAFESGKPWLESVMGTLADNRRLLGELLAEQLPAIRYRMPEAGYLAWLDCRELGWDDPAAVFLDRGRVALNSGLPFGPGGQGHARLNFATPEPVLREIVRRMALAVETADRP